MENGKEANRELQELLDEGKEEEFIKRLKDNSNLMKCKIKDSKSIHEQTLLQYCCRKNLQKAAKFLIDNGADLMEKAPKTEPPIKIAYFMGYFDLAKMLIESVSSRGDDLTKLVCEGLISLINSRGSDNYNKHEPYIKNLLEIVEQNNIDTETYKDENGQTVSFYALYFGCYDILIRLKAKTRFSDTILPSELEKIFDSCVHINESEPKPGTPNITFKYDSLCTEDSTKLSEISYFCNLIYDDKYIQLLWHPLVMCFFLLKWVKIKKYFYFHIGGYLVYMALFICLTFIHPTDNTSWILMYFLKGIIIFVNSVDITFWITMCTNLYSTCSSSKKNWKLSLLKMYIFHICITLTVITFVIISSTYEKHFANKILFIPLLIVAFKLILLSRLISIYGELFLIVLSNCIKVLAWMFVLFAIVSGIYYSTFNNLPQNNGNDFVTTLVIVFYKMFLLLVGELEDLAKDTPLNVTIYAVFVLVFTIVCANLLNALIIYDTNLLKKDALCIHQREIARYVHSFELAVEYFQGRLKFLKRLEKSMNFNNDNLKEIKGYINGSFKNVKKTQRCLKCRSSSDCIRLNENIIKSLNVLTRRIKKMPIFDCVIYTEQHIRDVEEDETPIRNTA
nr:PREDICTED: transient receptor potential cation channel protein painless-like isoform X1 [Tribolium castaneum]XP_015837055.1 PREDICTED: transient receptor potential cation channel protein painless-like isoform X1 [Tribolium castaneum]XP_015837062.1 PREDICTED: transient receptor potential cation channel protein painless-like isoform X1 [Tribolium castaneum]|eukprot:XP_015837053.1 PREDICTED: transient receptor potential cation channel protein painless-like isoform X1 [Tribolium castaneum]